MRKWTGAVAVVALTTALTACGGSKPDGCTAPSSAVVQAIAEGGKRDGFTIRSAQSVKGDSVYYVAANFTDGTADGQAVWATPDITQAGSIRSAEAMAEAVTTWPRLAGADAGSQPVRDALACLG